MFDVLITFRTGRPNLPHVRLWLIHKMAISFLMLVAAACGSLVQASVGGQGLRWQVYNNTAMMGSPILDSTLSSLALTVSGATPFSGEVTGTVSFPQDGVVKFSCNFANTSVAFVWIADHLVCQDGNVYKPTPGQFDNPLFVKAGVLYVVRVHVYYSLINQCEPATSFGCYNDSNHGCGFKMVERTDSLTQASCATYCHASGLAVAGPETGAECWCGAAAPTSCPKVDIAQCNTSCPGKPDEMCGAPWRLQAYSYACTTTAASSVGLSLLYNYFNASAPALLPTAWLQPSLPEPEQQRRALQAGVAVGWGSWLHRSIMAVVKLPEVSHVCSRMLLASLRVYIWRFNECLARFARVWC